MRRSCWPRSRCNLQRFGACRTQVPYQARQPVHPQPDISTSGTNLNLFHQQSDDARLLNREQLLPQRIQPRQGISRRILGQM